jgi:hypothetical protein
MDDPLWDSYCFNQIDEAERDFFVEEIAHRVDEDHLGVAPAKRLFQPFGPELKVKAVFKGVAWHPAETFREALGNDHSRH